MVLAAAALVKLGRARPGGLAPGISQSVAAASLAVTLTVVVAGKVTGLGYGLRTRVITGARLLGASLITVKPIDKGIPTVPVPPERRVGCGRRLWLPSVGVQDA